MDMRCSHCVETSEVQEQLQMKTHIRTTFVRGQPAEMVYELTDSSLIMHRCGRNADHK